MQMYAVVNAKSKTVTSNTALFKTHAAAAREMRFLQQEDARWREDALREAGHVIAAEQYAIVQVKV